MNAPAPEEISLGSLLAVLYRQRVFIAAGIVAVSLITAVAALFWPKTFEASAEILVSPAGYKKTMLLISEPYSVVTYEKIADNPSLKMNVVNQLRGLSETLRADGTDPRVAKLSEREKKQIAELDQDWLDDLGIVNIHEWMEVKTYIEEETNIGVKYANLLTLVARAPNAGAAAVLANLWAEAVLARDQQTIEHEAGQNIASTTGSALRVQNQLEQIARRRENTPTLALGEKDFNELGTLNATLYGKTQTQTSTEQKTGVTTSNETLADTGLYGQRQLAEQNVDARQKEIGRLAAMIGQQEEEGRWIGDPSVIQDPGRAQQQAATRKRDLEHALVESASRVAALSPQLVELASAEKTAYDAFVKHRITRIRPFQEEDKPIPPEIQAVADGLASVHDDAMRARKAKEAELDAAKAEETNLQNSLMAVEARADILTVLSAQKNHLSGESAGAPALEELRRRYRAYQDALTTAQTELFAAQSERDSLARRIQALEGRRDELQLPVNQYLVERDNLERKLKLQGAFFESPENLARLVEADAGELLRAPNLALSSTALPPNKRISPKHTRMVLIGALGAAMVFTLLAFVREGLANLPPEARRRKK